ncbi:MAG: glycosyl hydrolase family 18 protein [Bacillota bacterium]
MAEHTQRKPWPRLRARMTKVMPVAWASLMRAGRAIRPTWEWLQQADRRLDARLEPTRLRGEARLRQGWEWLWAMDERLEARFLPVQERAQNQLGEWWAWLWDLDHRVQAKLHPAGERLRRRWRKLLRAYPALDRAASRMETLFTHFAGILAATTRFAGARWPRGWRPSWPPHKPVDWVAAGALLLVLVAALPAGPQPLPRPAPVPVRRPLEVIGYFENGVGGIFVPSFPVLRQQQHLIDTVAPFWYSVDWEGKVVFPRQLPEVVSFARQNGMRLIPLVNNIVAPKADNARMIATPQARAKTVANLVSLVETQGYDGLNIYFPWLGPEARDNFTAFITDLGSELRGRNRLLAVSVYPREGSSAEVHGHFDYAALARAADYLILMAYDHHWEGSESGPTSPLPWVRENVISALQDVPADRLVLATGLFGYDWTVPARAGVTQYLPSKDATARARRLGVAVRRDDQSGQPFYRYRAGNLNHQVWYEDLESFDEKLALALEHGLRGIALWRLGFEEGRLWATIQQQLGRR